MTTFSASQFVSDSLFSDMHKEIYGSRPGSAQYARWHAMSEAELIAEQNELIAGCERACNEEIARAADAAQRFEAAVATTIAAGAQTREVAIRWMIDAEGDAVDVERYGMEHFEWSQGLSFGYLAGAARPLWTREA